MTLFLYKVSFWSTWLPNFWLRFLFPLVWWKTTSLWRFRGHSRTKSVGAWVSATLGQDLPWLGLRQPLAALPLLLPCHTEDLGPAQGLGALWHQIQNNKCFFSANSVPEHCVRHSKMSRGMRRGPGHKDRTNWKSRCAQINCKTQHRAKSKSFGTRQTWVQISVDHFWVVIWENYLNLILKKHYIGDNNDHLTAGMELKDTCSLEEKLWPT